MDSYSYIALLLIEQKQAHVESKVDTWLWAELTFACGHVQEVSVAVWPGRLSGSTS